MVASGDVGKVMNVCSKLTGVTNIGWGTVKLHNYNEEYVLTFPNGYGRSIMSTPWIELGGKVNFTIKNRLFAGHKK